MNRISFTELNTIEEWNSVQEQFPNSYRDLWIGGRYNSTAEHNYWVESGTIANVPEMWKSYPPPGHEDYRVLMSVSFGNKLGIGYHSNYCNALCEIGNDM